MPTPITFPLDYSVTRCLAHTQRVGEWCEKYMTCACHQTIPHDDPRQNLPILERKCSDDAHHCYIPVDGFPDDVEAVDWSGKGCAA